MEQNKLSFCVTERHRFQPFCLVLLDYWVLKRVPQCRRCFLEFQLWFETPSIGLQHSNLQHIIKVPSCSLNLIS
ncbi:hypothetical protein Peur_000866 [Populus x canadensis]